jgi:mannosyltransferase OCH1-like enzyme
MIPKIIHQTWKTNNIPDEWKNAVNSCKIINNDFTYILWTHETMDIFVKENYPDLYTIYKSYKHDIQRCDAFRYLVLYKYGGVYLDMDIICKKNLNNLLHFDLVLAKSSNIETTFTNSFFMVVPNHPFFKYCIDNLADYKDNFQYFGKHLHVMNSTGPLFLTNLVNHYGKIPNYYILTKKEYAGDCNICNETICNGGTYFTHIPGNTWHGLDSTIYNFVFCNKKIIGLTIFFLICIIFYIFYKKKQRIFTQYFKATRKRISF